MLLGMSWVLVFLLPALLMRDSVAFVACLFGRSASLVGCFACSDKRRLGGLNIAAQFECCGMKLLDYFLKIILGLLVFTSSFTSVTLSLSFLSLEIFSSPFLNPKSFLSSIFPTFLNFLRPEIQFSLFFQTKHSQPIIRYLLVT